MDCSDSRKRLRNYRDEETLSTESKKQLVLNEIAKVCDAVNVKVLTTNEEQCIYKIADYVKGGSLRPLNSSVNLVHRSGFLNELIEEIKITFTGCIITLDRSETYITVDWS